jgi:hypothetical protein
MRRYNDRGVGNWTLLIFGLLTAAVVYTAFQIIPIYYNYFDLENQMYSLISVSGFNTDQEIRRKLSDHIRRTQLPAQIENLRIQRQGDSMRMSLDYKEVFEIGFRDRVYRIHTFAFRAQAEGQIGKKRSRWR